MIPEEIVNVMNWLCVLNLHRFESFEFCSSYFLVKACFTSPVPVPIKRFSLIIESPVFKYSIRCETE